MAELTQERLKEIREHKDRAFDMVSALCKPRGTEGSREWIMSIPARPDHDPDLVIGAALKDIDALLAHIDAQADEIERLRRVVEDAQSAPQRAQEWMRANGVQVADLSVPMQRAVFEVYNLLVELAQQAEAALAEAPDKPENPLAAYTDGQLYDELRRRGWVAATWAREEALLSDKEGDVDDVHEVPPELVDTACPVCDEPRLWCWCDGEKGGDRRE